MLSGLQGLVTGEQIAVWLVIAFLVAFFIYKEYPEFKKRITKGALKEQTDEQAEKTVLQRLDAIEKKLEEMNDKLTRDYDRINTMEKEQKELKKLQRNSLEERGIIMRALLALMNGVPETKEVSASEQEIQDYLVRQSHADILE